MSAPILVASDGEAGSLGALRIARKLEERDGRPVEVMGVVAPLPVFDAGFTVSLPEAELVQDRQEILRRAVEDQLEDVRGSRTAWPLTVDVGLPGPRIATRAEEIGAELILVGLGRHRPVDRLLGTETALRVIRLSHVPVLAVPAEADDLPRVAVLAMDFSPFSARAARTARSVLKSPATVHVAHAISDIDFLPGVSDAFEEEYGDEVADRLATVIRGLEYPEGWTVRAHVLEGEAASEILALASREDADLVVSGSHGHSFMGRLLVGSVSTRLVRGADAAVLVAPPSGEPGGGAEAGAPEGEVHPWVELLSSFTARNAGRRTTLEVDDPELGAQHAGTNFPLFGVDYDPRSDRVEIMLGRQGTVEGHITHAIASPRAVEVHTEDDGTEVLRIELPSGQVILRVER